MNVITKDEFLLKKDYYIKLIEEGSIFIYPTDNSYRIGCDARNKIAIKRVRELKKIDKQPLSIIVPNIEWITENCITTEEIEDELEKLPGKYKFILNTNDLNELSENVNPNDDSICLRIPDIWFAEFIKEINFPIIATSANTLGNDFMTSIDNIDKILADHVDFIIYDGEIKRSKSIVYDFKLNDI